MTLTSTMDALIHRFATCFTKASFKTLCAIVTAWLLGSGRRRVTHILLAGDGLKVKTFSCYHRFFRQARWTVDAVGRVMLALVMKFIPKDAPLVMALDDTLDKKAAAPIPGLGGRRIMCKTLA